MGTKDRLLQSSHMMSHEHHMTAGSTYSRAHLRAAQSQEVERLAGGEDVMSECRSDKCWHTLLITREGVAVSPVGLV